MDATLSPHAAIGDRLQGTRHALGCTLAEFAAKNGMSRSTLIPAERGGMLPRAATRRRLAEVGGVAVDWLTGRAAEPATQPAGQGGT